jgi:nicotinate-nucleotide adenylyltransferase
VKIGILGGAFDPIHNDHLATARAVLDAGLVDRVNIMPCYGHNFGKQMAPAEVRLYMTAIACSDAFAKTGHRIYPSDLEIISLCGGSTYNFVSEILAPSSRESGHEYCYIIGSDNAKQIQKWHKWEALLKAIKFIVVQRAGQALPESNDWFMQAPHQYLKSDIGGISSTLVRETILKQDWNKLETLVPEPVYRYIRQRLLYLV